MDAQLQDYLDSYKNMIKMYADRLDANNLNLKETNACMAEMTEIAKKTDYMGFMQTLTDRDLFNKMTALLTDLSKEISKVPVTTQNIRIPSAKDAAMGYHAAYNAMQNKSQSTKQIYQRVFQIESESVDGAQFVRKMAEEKLYIKMSSVPLAESAIELKSGAEALSLPAMVHHHECMIEMSQNAATAAEMEFESQKLAEFNVIETMWDNQFLNLAYVSLGNPISSYLLTHSEEDRVEVENACNFLADFFSIEPLQIFEIPRIKNYVEKFILKAANKEKVVYPNYAAYVKECADVIAKCRKKTVPLGPASRKSVTLWGKTVSMSDAENLLRKPPRPQIQI